MLQLRSSVYEINQLMATDYRRFDYAVRGQNGVPDVGYIYTKYIESALLPLAFNEIGILQQSYGIGENFTIEDTLEAMENLYNDCSQTRLGIIRIYTSDVDAMYNSMTSDLYTSPVTAVQELYNKCMDQVRLREDVNRTITTKVKLMKGKHIIVLVSDYDDVNQASDYFLTVGLVPVLFQDWKEKFNEQELEYFKVLVNRSQVKRISNVKAQEAFDIIASSNKYNELISAIRLKTTLNNIVAHRIDLARRTLAEAERQAVRLMQEYETLRIKFFKSEKELNTLEANREAALEELNTAVSIEGIANVAQASSDYLQIIFKTPIVFYNTDEAELVINNMREDWVKRFMTDIFINNKYKLHVMSSFMYGVRGEDTPFRSPGEVPIEILESYKALYNPHTYFFSCLGDYKPQLINAQAQQDLLMFNNIALASVKSINFRDGAVMNRWCNTLRSYAETSGWMQQKVLNIKCLEDEDGNFHSINDIYFSEVEELEVREV